MVVRNVPKLHSRRFHVLVGLLAATAALPTGCSDDEFEGCEASRTCPPKNGDAGEGTGGESGGGNDTGGNSGSSGSSNGGNGGTSSGGGSAGGSDDGGDGSGGSGGSGDDDEAPTIVSITPGDGDVDVERDVTVTIEFSEAIDEDSVTETSVVLTGPDGDVAGTLGVDGNVVSFTAEKKLYLLGDYEIAIDESVADLAGNALERGDAAGFRVRDGRWSEPTYPFGTAVSRWVNQFGRNRGGNAVVGIEQLPGPTRVFGSVFSALEGTWTNAEELRSGTALFAHSAAIDDEGQALVSWSGDQPAGSGWSRFDRAQQWVSSTLGGAAQVAVTSTGTGMAILYEGSTLVTRTQNMLTGSVGTATPLGVADVLGVAPVSSLDRMAAVGSRSTPAGQEVFVAWFDGSIWGVAEPLGAAEEILSVVVDSDEQGNVLVVWVADDEIWSRTYDRARDEWTRSLLIATAPADTYVYVAPPDMTAGRAVIAFNTFDPDAATWAAIYEAGVGWLENATVRLDPDWTGGAVGVTIDERGYALAAWRPEGKSLQYRRYLPEGGWQVASTIDGGEVNPYMLWSVGAPDGTTTVVGNEALGAAQQTVWTNRFE